LNFQSRKTCWNPLLPCRTVGQFVQSSLLLFTRRCERKHGYI